MIYEKSNLEKNESQILFKCLLCLIGSLFISKGSISQIFQEQLKLWFPKKVQTKNEREEKQLNFWCKKLHSLLVKPNLFLIITIRRKLAINFLPFLLCQWNRKYHSWAFLIYFFACLGIFCVSRCQFHQHFMHAFFHTKVSLKAFFVLTFKVWTFLAQQYWHKFAPKMLVKLTEGLAEIKMKALCHLCF